MTEVQESKVHKSTESTIKTPIFKEYLYSDFLTQKTEKNPDFLQDNTVILSLAHSIDTLWLKNWLKPTLAILPILGQFFIKIPQKTRILNNLLLDVPRGCGKTELLINLLAKNNPSYFSILPEKVFESELITKPRKFFNNKIVVQSDLIASFTGVNKKQRQQLTNFWTGILDGGNYSRDKGTQLKEVKNLRGVRTAAIFGIASEMMPVFHEQLLNETFLDRIPPMRVSFTDEEKREILEFRDTINKEDKEPPKIILPKKNPKIKIAFPFDNEEITKKVNNYAMNLDIHEIQSFARAQQYIQLFMQANAALNNRKEITQSDLDIYSIVHPLFIESSWNLSMETKVREVIISNPSMEDKERIKLAGMSKQTFYKYKKILRRKGVIQ